MPTSALWAVSRKKANCPIKMKGVSATGEKMGYSANSFLIHFQAVIWIAGIFFSNLNWGFADPLDASSIDLKKLIALLCTFFA